MTKKSKKRLKKLVIQFAEYCVAGGAWFWSAYIITILLDPIIGLGWANVVGNLVGVTINYFLSALWVFKTKNNKHAMHASWKYIIYTALNFALSAYLLKLMRGFGIEPEISQFITAGFFTVWNFAWYKLWVFKDTPHAKRIRHHA
jgi:putative flippase GtrA